MSVMDKVKGYKFTQKPDELIVHDFEIFCECSRHGKEFGEAWIKAAAAEAKIGQDDGHMMPLNYLHHSLPGETPQKPVWIGFAEVTRVEPMSFRGRKVMGIIADLHIRKEEYFERIAKGHFPFRSVEIFNRDVAKINCVSLLDDEPPFLELPIMIASDIQRMSRGVANATFESTWDPYSDKYGSPVVASSAVGQRIHLFSRIDGEVTMVEATKKPPEPKKAERMQSEDGEKEKKPDSEKKEYMEEGEGGGGPDVGAVVKAIKSGKISIADFAEIKMAMEEAEAGTKSEPDEEQPAQAAIPGMESMKKDMSPELARMQGRIDALETKLASRDEDDAVRSDVDEAEQRLEGRLGGAQPRSKLEQFRRSHGKDAFKSYVDGLCEQFGVIPDKTTGDGFVASRAPEEAMRFQAHGSGAVDKAAAFAREYDALKEGGHDIRQSRKRYIELNMRHAGFDVPQNGREA